MTPMKLKSIRGVIGIDDLLLIAVIGVVSWYGVHEHKQLITAHTAAKAAQSENVQAKAAISDLVAAESTQRAAQAKEDAARAEQEKARCAKGQTQQVALTAAKASLEQTPPAVEPAKKFVALAADAGDTPTPETLAAGLALAQATEAAQAQEIADLRAQIVEQKDTIETQAVKIDQAHTDNITAVKKIEDLTGTVAVHVEKEGEQEKVIATVTDQTKSLSAKLLLATAEIGRWVAALIVAILAGLVLWHFHLVLRSKHAALTVAHASLQTAHTTLQAAHADTLKAINQTTP